MIPFPIISQLTIIKNIGLIKTYSASANSHLFLSSAGELMAFGLNPNGMFGNGTNTELTEVTTILTGVSNFWANPWLNIVLMNDGTVLGSGLALTYFGWGTNIITFIDLTSHFSTINGIKDLTVGFSPSNIGAAGNIIVQDTNNVLYGVGRNQRGQLGVATPTSFSEFTIMGTCTKIVGLISGACTVILDGGTLKYTGSALFVASDTDVKTLTTLDTNVLDCYPSFGSIVMLKTDGMYMRGFTNATYGVAGSAKDVFTKCTIPFDFDPVLDIIVSVDKDNIQSSNYPNIFLYDVSEKKYYVGGTTVNGRGGVPSNSGASFYEVHGILPEPSKIQQFQQCAAFTNILEKESNIMYLSGAFNNAGVKYPGTNINSDYFYTSTFNK